MENQSITNEIEKLEIISRFHKAVRGRAPDLSGFHSKHAGAAGHWLEEKMGVHRNSLNSPDILGYEMKTDTASKTSFGDWSASLYIYNTDDNIDRSQFMQAFGQFNKSKQRYSWSGKPCPKISGFNEYGQILKIGDNGDITALYSFSEDKRENKCDLVPYRYQVDNLALAIWQAEDLKSKVEDKFNQKGWFICLKNENGRYDRIAFGPPITYSSFLNMVGAGEVYFDSGMHEGNPRNYSQWRANNTVWYKMVLETY